MSSTNSKHPKKKQEPKVYRLQHELVPMSPGTKLVKTIIVGVGSLALWLLSKFLGIPLDSFFWGAKHIEYKVDQCQKDKRD